MTIAVRDADGNRITPEVVVAAYLDRCFPMADGRDGHINWFRPPERAVITWDRWKVPPSLRKTARQAPYRLTIDVAFDQVIAACAQRDETWISGDIEALYGGLFDLGVAHSIEAWRGDELVGGLYGLALGGCFCGESMFHRADDASKLAMMHLVAHLHQRGFVLVDCQQQTPHMERFGARLISDADYAELFTAAVALPITF